MNNYCDITCGIVVVCCFGRDEDANGKEEKKEKDKVGDKAGAAGDDSGSDKEIVKEWRTRSRGLDKGTVVFSAFI